MALLNDESIVQEIDGRLAALRAEITKLETARALFVGGDTPSPAPARAAAGNGRKSTRRRGRPAGSTNGNRADQAFSIVQAQPGIAIPGIAKAMGIEPNYLYRVMPRLVNEGRVRKEGQGYAANVS